MPDQTPQIPHGFDPKRFDGSLGQQPAVSPSEALEIFKKRQPNTAVYRVGQEKKSAPSESGSLNATEGAPSIVEQARALRHKPELIYEFVRNSVEFIPTYGLQKGGLGALIDGSGNSFDQSDLMIQLLRESGYTANFVIGQLLLSPSQWSNWLGIATSDVIDASQLLINGGIPNAYYPTTSELALLHCWVQVSINSEDLVFDPSIKGYDYQTGISSLATHMSYDRTSFLNDAKSGPGYSETADYVKGVNSSAIQADLTSYSSNLVSWIKENNSGATVNDILGGKTIVPSTVFPHETDLPYQDPNVDPLITDAIPDILKTTFQIQYDKIGTTNTYNIDKTFFTDEIYSKRVTLWFNASRVATLNLDGTALDSSSAQPANSTKDIKFTITHPYPWADPTFVETSPVVTGSQTTIVSAWGVRSKQLTQIHQEAQNQSVADGVSANAESMLGQSMLLIWDNFISQVSAGIDLSDRINQCCSIINHAIGTISQLTVGTKKYKTLNAKWNFNSSSLVPTADYTASLYCISMLFQTLEAAAIQQVSGIETSGSPTYLKICNDAGYKIYDAKSTNWTTGTNVRNIMSSLTPVAYPSYALADADNWIANNFRIAMPDTASITVGSLSGAFTYTAIGPNKADLFGFNWIQSVPYKGAISNDDQSDDETNSSAFQNVRQVNGFGQPTASATESQQVDSFKGRFQYSAMDLRVGNQGFPYELAFVRSYNSALRLTFNGLGFGWSHNWLMNAIATSDGLVAFGEQEVSAAATAIACLFVCRDIHVSDSSFPIQNFMINCIAMDFLKQQCTNNVVRLQLGAGTLVYTKMADGTYLPPAGNNGVSQLELISGAYKYTSPEKYVYTFATNGKIQSISFPFDLNSDISINFTYTSGRLTKVTNGFRSLNFTYDTYGQLSSVNDGLGRSVTITLPYSTGNLTAVKDPENNTTTYEYDQRGRLTKIFKPANPTDAIVTNTYDTLNRVKEQTDAFNNVWQFFIAGSRSEQVGPDGSPEGCSTIAYFNDLGSVLNSIDALGFSVKCNYDGKQRLVEAINPEGDRRTYIYDGNSNVTSITTHAKPGSGLADRSTTFEYDSVWTSAAKKITDTAGNITLYTYGPVGAYGAGKIIKTELPTVAAGTPTSIYSYNKWGQLLTTTGATGTVQENTYNATTHNIEKTVIDPTGKNIQYLYAFNSVGDMTSCTDPLANVTSAIYDKNRMPTQTTEPGKVNMTTFFSYDENGNELTSLNLDSADPASQLVSGVYEIDGKIKSTLGPVNFAEGGQPIPTICEYDSLRRVSRIIDPIGRIATFTYDKLNRVIARAINGTIVERSSFTPNGLLETTTDAKNNITTYLYDGYDRLSETVYPDNTSESSEYDELDNVTTFTDRAGNAFAFTFDNNNQPLTRSVTGKPTVSFSYNLESQRVSVSTPIVLGDPCSGTFAYSYDSAGRLYKETFPDGKAVSVTLDNNGNATQIVHPDGSIVSLASHSSGVLTEVNGFSASIKYEYDSASRQIGQICGNGVGQGLFWDKLNSLLNLSISGIKSSTSITVPKRLDITSKFDDFGETIQRSFSDASCVWEPVSSSSTTYGAANAVNQYPSVDSETLQWDANGCLIDDGAKTYTYDVQHKLSSVSGTFGTVNYSYDPLGRLTLRSTASESIRYLYYGSLRIEEYDNSTDTLRRRYLYGNNCECFCVVEHASGQIRYLHTDDLGSVIYTTDSMGVVLSHNVYSLWGELMEGSLNPVSIGYSGQFFDSDTGLYYLCNRFYSPSLARFIQPDPRGNEAGLNHYEYCDSNPINASDASGLSPGDDNLLLSGHIYGSYVPQQAPNYSSLYGLAAALINQQLATLAAFGIPGGIPGLPGMFPPASNNNNSGSPPATIALLVTSPPKIPPPPAYLARLVSGLRVVAMGVVAIGAALTLADLLLIGTCIAVGLYAGGRLQDHARKLSQIAKARAARGVQHGNDLRSQSPTYVYEIYGPPFTPANPAMCYRNETRVGPTGTFKYGIGTAGDGGARARSQRNELNDWYKKTYNIDGPFRYRVVAFHTNRLSAKKHEEALDAAFWAANGKLPPGTANYSQYR